MKWDNENKANIIKGNKVLVEVLWCCYKHIEAMQGSTLPHLLEARARSKNKDWQIQLEGESGLILCKFK